MCRFDREWRAMERDRQECNDRLQQNKASIDGYQEEIEWVESIITLIESRQGDTRPYRRRLRAARQSLAMHQRGEDEIMIIYWQVVDRKTFVENCMVAENCPILRRE